MLFVVFGGKMVGKSSVRGSRHIGRQAHIMATLGSIIVQREERISSVGMLEGIFYVEEGNTDKSCQVFWSRNPASAF